MVVPYALQLAIAIFVAVTLVVYVIVVMALCTTKTAMLKNSFYRLNIALGITDIANLLVTNLLHRLPNTADWIIEWIVQSGRILPEICNKGGIILFCWQKYFLLIIVVNRFTAVAFPVGYDKIWSPKNLRVIYAIPIIVGLVFWIPTWIYVPAIYFGKPWSNVTICIMIDWKMASICAYVMIVFVIAASICNFVLSGIAVLFLCTQKRHQKVTHLLSIELKLTLMTLLLTVILAITAYTGAMGMLFAPPGDTDYLAWNYLAQDLLSASHPYLLLLFSSALRQRFLGNGNDKVGAQLTLQLHHRSTGGGQSKAIESLPVIQQ